MCGRFVATTSPYDLADYFGAILTPAAEDMPSSFNVAPSRQVLTISQVNDHREVVARRWGLIPSWAKELAIGNKMINARAETVAEKPSFRSAFKQRRCLVPVDGFYEWTTEAGQSKKQPWFIFDLHGRPLAFAGLWETWKDPHGTGPDIGSCTIITVAAGEKMARLHHRQPVFLAEDSWESWLDPSNNDTAALATLLSADTGIEVDYYRVSTLVNSARSSGASLIEPVGAPGSLF